MVRADRKVGGRVDSEAPDHWRSTQVSLIQDKLTNTAIDRVKGTRQSSAARRTPCPTTNLKQTRVLREAVRRCWDSAVSSEADPFGTYGWTRLPGGVAVRIASRRRHTIAKSGFPSIGPVSKPR